MKNPIKCSGLSVVGLGGEAIWERERSFREENEGRDEKLTNKKRKRNFEKFEETKEEEDNNMLFIAKDTQAHKHMPTHTPINQKFMF